MMRVFRDRHDAGVQLARALQRYAEAADVVVLAHTHGSVPVAYEVATRLALPLAMADDHEITIKDKTVIVVDDGDTAREICGAIETQRARGAATVVVAIPVSPPQVFAMLHAAADQVVCVLLPQHIYSVQAWFAEFEDPQDDDVRQMLVAAAQNLLGERRGHFLSTAVDT
jgi:predicted phosphoribosyltransferase